MEEVLLIFCGEHGFQLWTQVLQDIGQLSNRISPLRFRSTVKSELSFCCFNSRNGVLSISARNRRFKERLKARRRECEDLPAL